MQITLYEIITYFVIYSFFGWIMESVYRSIRERKIINTGFLFGPFCPIYGIGSIFVILFFQGLKDNIPLLFAVSFVMMTSWEYIVGILLEKIFHTKYWDYSENKFNIKGRVCLENSIAWGILGVVFIHFIHPMVVKFLQFANYEIIQYLIYVLLIYIIIDACISIIRLKNLQTAITKINELGSEIKEKAKRLSEIKVKKQSNINDEQREEIVNLQKTIYQLKRKQKRIAIMLYRKVYKIKRTFPTLNTTKEMAYILGDKFKKLKEQNVGKLEEEKRKIKMKQENVKKRKTEVKEKNYGK